MAGRKHPGRSGPVHRAIDGWISRPGGATVLVVIFLILAAIPAALVFDNASPFDNNDPDSAGQRAQRLHTTLTGARIDPEVVLLAREGAESEPPPEIVERRLGEIKGVAATSRIELIDDAGIAVLGTLSAAGGHDRSAVGERAEEIAEQSRDYTAGGVAVASHRLESKSERETRIIEAAVAPILFLLLLVVFRGFVAALLPLIVGGAAITLTFAGLSLLTEVRDIDVFSLQTVTALGTGLAIDYSLFMLSRYREERLRQGPRGAMRSTYSSAGATVAFSAVTIAVAVLALVVFPSPFLRSSGMGAAMVAVSAGIAALTLLPATILLLDGRLTVPESRIRRSESDLISRLISRSVTQPVALPLLGFLIALALAVPVLNLDLTIPDAEVLPTDDPARVTAELVALKSGFPANTLTAIAPSDNRDQIRKARNFAAQLPGVVSVGQPQAISEDYKRIRISAEDPPLSPNGQAIVAQTRAAPWPPGTLIGGRATELTDQEASITDKLPWVLGILAIATTLLMLLMTRSLRIALLAVAMNTLTVGASLGILVLVFQTELLEGVLGFESLGAIDITVPLLTSTAVFGLSTDYGIFVLSRINEAGGAGHVAGRNLVAALTATTRLVSAAAIVFSVALGAFLFSDLIFVKQIAVALVSAVLIDAFVIRPLIIPGVLQLLAERGPALPRPPGSPR